MSGQGHSRRDFLRGRAAVAAAVEAVEAAIDTRLGGLSERRPAPAGPPVTTLSRRAMACEFEMRIAHPDTALATEAGMAALNLVDEVEDQLTVYRDESDLIELNADATDGEAVDIDPELFGLLTLCDRIHRDTDGAFDPTSGPLSQVWGFHRRAGRVPSEEELAEALDRVGWAGVHLDAARRAVRFEPGSDLELNANSIGKGHALDRAVTALIDLEVDNALLHGGRSTLLARGSNPALSGGGWRAGLRDPLRPERHVALLSLRDEALSTSGQGTQFFEHEGRRYGHLIDPRTGWPAAGLYSASVLAPTAAEADAFSTAAYILGLEGTAELCRRRPELQALLLAPSTDEAGAECVAVHAFNLPEADWRPSEPP